MILQILFKKLNFEDKLTKIENKIPDINNLATKSSITSLLPTSTFNSKITEIENKITNVDNKTSANTAVGIYNKAKIASEINSKKDDYVSNAVLDLKSKDLKSQHIADEIKKIDDKTKKNSSDILRFESRLKQKEDIVDEGQTENSFARGLYYYLN